MLQACVDHLVVTAASLADGMQYVHQALGVELEVGGEHPRMGTHNCLLRLGDAVFLEVIAINPRAPHPGRPRWFQLDALGPDSPPRLATWVMRTNGIHTALAASPIPLGVIEPMTRGQLHWLITIPADGSLPMHGIAPVCIEWQAQPHPASKLQNQGCSLVRLEACHAEAELLSGMLAALGYRGVFSVRPAVSAAKTSLVATIQTPSGLRQLGF